MQPAVRALVVDDSAFMRCAIGRILEGVDGVGVVGYAHDGREAVDKARALKPDLVTLDIEMPEMDGLQALPRIRHACSAKVLMVSSLTHEGTSATLTALRLGAVDFISKDQSQITRDLAGMEADLRAKVSALFPSRGAAVAAAAAPPTRKAAKALGDLGRIDAIVIGASTGGPPVLEELIAALPAAFGAPVVVAQHMPEMFTRTMAERLNEMASVRVLHAEQMLPMRPGHVYIAMGGRHARVTRRRSAALWVDSTDQPADALYKPSVDELFRSASASCGAHCLGIVLTGMGEDGVHGARELHAAGAPIIAQDEQSCVVYGMPKAVTEAGLIRASMTPGAIAAAMRAAAPDRAPHDPVKSLPGLR